jgi:hypothetical protein
MSLTKLESEDIKKMLVDIQLSLSICNNTITTDAVDATEDEMHWRINHNQQIQQIDEIAKLLNINLCNDPQCLCDSNDL